MADGMLATGISHIILPDGEVYELTDHGDYPLYSTADLQRGSDDSDIDLFKYTEDEQVAATQQTVAAALRFATERDTNVEEKGRMGEDEAMAVFSIRIEVHESQVPDEAGGGDENETFVGFQPNPSIVNLKLLNHYLVGRLQMSGDKDFELHVPGWFVAGYGPFGIGTVPDSAAAANVGPVGVNGQPGHHAARWIRIPHLIEPTEDYHFRLSNPDGKLLNWVTPDGGTVAQTQLRLKVTLVGPRRRSVGVLAPAQLPGTEDEPVGVLQ